MRIILSTVNEKSAESFGRIVASENQIRTIFSLYLTHALVKWATTSFGRQVLPSACQFLLSLMLVSRRLSDLWGSKFGLSLGKASRPYNYAAHDLQEPTY